jgi:putative hydrolase of the HAD superfamily
VSAAGQRSVVEAVLFDIDGTLFDHDAASAQSLRRRLALELQRADLDDEEFHAALAEWRRLELLHYDHYLTGVIDLLEQRRRRTAGILEWAGAGERSPAELEEWFELFLDGYEEGWVAFEDTDPALTALESRGDLQLGVITNADADIQRRKLSTIGVAERLPAFVASSAVGCAKPDPAIFAAACELVELAPERVAYVGDRLDVDALGARDAGLVAVWLDRPGATTPVPADAPREGISVISGLAELPAALGLAD